MELSNDASVEKGFTIIEILIALAIMTIVGAAIMSVMGLVNNARQNSLSQLGRDNFRATLLQAFDHPALCKTTLYSQAPAHKQNPTIFNELDATTTGLPLNITLNNTLPGGVGAIQIRSLDPTVIPAPSPIPLPQFNIAYQFILFKNAVNLTQKYNQTDPNYPTDSLWQGTVTMTASKLGGVSDLTTPIIGGNSLPMQTIGSLLLTVTSGGVIDACQTVFSIEDTCTSLGGIPNPAGPTATPQCIPKDPCGPNQINGQNQGGQSVCLTFPASCPGSGLVLNAAQTAYICQAL